jgi:hypothetical protein
MGRKQDNGMFLWVGRQAQVVDRKRERDITWNDSQRGIIGVLLYYWMWNRLKLDVTEETREH